MTMLIDTTKKVRLGMIGLCILSVLFLSACSSQNTSSTSVHAQGATPLAPSPTPTSRLTEDGTMQLQAYQQWIGTLQEAHGDPAPYQKLYEADSKALKGAQSDAAYQAALKTLKAHIAAIRLPVLKAQTADLRQQLRQKVAAWGKNHTHFNAYDQTTYPLGYEYGEIGAEWALDNDFGAVESEADYQLLLDKLNLYLDFFATMTANTADKTPYNSPHASDLKLLSRYNLQGKKVVVVSLQEQTMRLYQNGKLFKAFWVTTGRPTHPSLPGIWNVETKETHIVFKSGVPKTSPDYYEDTPINYAMQYHTMGYYLHDSYWRADYGPNTQFPHQDSTGNTSAATGSHGCINMTTALAIELFDFVDVGTPIVVY